MNYWNDIRDTFEELYYSSSSFVRIDKDFNTKTPHIIINLDLENEHSKTIFKLVCYAYEDSFDWNQVPLFFKHEDKEQSVEWKKDGIYLILKEKKDIIDKFDLYTNTLLLDNKCTQTNSIN